VRTGGGLVCQRCVRVGGRLCCSRGCITREHAHTQMLMSMGFIREDPHHPFSSADLLVIFFSGNFW
jgi:hypothetical protein